MKKSIVSVLAMMAAAAVLISSSVLAGELVKKSKDKYPEKIQANAEALVKHREATKDLPNVDIGDDGNGGRVIMPHPDRKFLNASSKWTLEEGVKVVKPGAFAQFGLGKKLNVLEATMLYHTLFFQQTLYLVNEGLPSKNELEKCLGVSFTDGKFQELMEFDFESSFLPATPSDLREYQRLCELKAFPEGK
jgi:hypothetical protein